jgi:hypothetical protein
MVAVPASTPDTMPLVPIVATDVLLLVHVPPVTVFDNVIVVLTATVFGPVMDPALGSGLTVTILVATALPQLLVTV